MTDLVRLLDFRTFLELTDNIYDEICIWDNDYTIVYINKACYHHYGLFPEELIGKTLQELSVNGKYWTPSSVPYIYKEKSQSYKIKRPF